MSKFVTTIKTNYTNKQVSADKKEFITPYSSKMSKKVITGENRCEHKRFASRLVK